MKAIDGDSQFESIFREGEDWTTDAMIHPRFRGHESAYTEGYLEAGNRLVNSIAEGRGDLDFLIFPIVFLYRHYLELQLKEINRIGRSFFGETDNPLVHNFETLWDETLKVISKAFPDDNPPEDFEFLQHVVMEFAQIDAGSFTFRYATSKNGSPSLTKEMRINVKVLQATIQKTSSILTGIAECLLDFQQLKEDGVEDVEVSGLDI